MYKYMKQNSTYELFSCKRVIFTKNQSTIWYLLVDFFHHCPFQLPHQNHRQSLHKSQTSWELVELLPVGIEIHFQDLFIPVPLLGNKISELLHVVLLT